MHVKAKEPCCLLDIRKAIFRNTHLPLFISRLIFCATTLGGKKKIKEIICQAFAICNYKDKNQTAVISQRIELSEFTAACVIIIIKQTHVVRQLKKKCSSPQSCLSLALNSSLNRSHTVSFQSNIGQEYYVFKHMNHHVNKSRSWTALLYTGCHTAATYWTFNLPTCFTNSKEDNENVKAICTLILHRHADVAQCQKWI